MEEKKGRKNNDENIFIFIFVFVHSQCLNLLEELKNKNKRSSTTLICDIYSERDHGTERNK